MTIPDEIKSNKVSWILCWLVSINIVLCCFIFLMAVPRLEMIYRELGVKLPGFTELLIDVSRNYIWLFGLLYSIANPLFELKFNGSSFRLVFNILSFLGVLLLQMFIIISATVPLLIIIEKLPE